MFSFSCSRLLQVVTVFQHHIHFHRYADDTLLYTSTSLPANFKLHNTNYMHPYLTPQTNSILVHSRVTTWLDEGIFSSHLVSHRNHPWTPASPEQQALHCTFNLQLITLTANGSWQCQGGFWKPAWWFLTPWGARHKGQEDTQVLLF